MSEPLPTYYNAVKFFRSAWQTSYKTGSRLPKIGELSASTGPAADLVIDPFTRGERGELVLTGTTFVDAVPRWP
jgi:hypothetical protein